MNEDFLKWLDRLENAPLTPHIRPATDEETKADLDERGWSTGTRPFTGSDHDLLRLQIRTLRTAWAACQRMKLPIDYVGDLDALRKMWRDTLGSPPLKFRTPKRLAQAQDALDYLVKKLDELDGIASDVPKPVAGIAPAISKPGAAIWTPPDSPGRWAKKYNVASPRTLKRWNDIGKIKIHVISKKSWCIKIDTLPLNEQAKYLTSK